MEFPDGKRYLAFSSCYRHLFGERLQKLVIDAGFSCPNRDGSVGTGGCTYCDNAAFHPNYSTPGKSILEQLEEGIEFHRRRYPRVKHYLAYFQAYSNTYGSLERLRQVYEEALSHPAVVGIVIGTRPDCIDAEKLDYLAALSQGDVLKEWRHGLTLAETGEALTAPLVSIEYGIESCYDATLRRINRGHDFSCARRAVKETSSRGLEVGAHFILGLPGESRKMMFDECRAISELPLNSVKFHQLQLIKGTRMEQEYAAFPSDFETFSLNEYIDFMVSMLERLRPDLYIERIAGEVPPRFVSKTPWGLIRNPDLLHLLDLRLEQLGTYQGRRYSG